MKRTVLISLICSMVAVVVIMIAVMLGLVLMDVISVEPQKLVITSESTTKIYDGEALKAPNWNLAEGELRDGHTMTVNVTGVQQNVGISENHVSAVIRDENGADVTEDYNIEYRPGILNVRARDITLIADSAMKKYDGTPLTSDKYYIEQAISLISTDTIEVEISGSITEIGSEKNSITKVTITNENGEDVTRNYNITATDGTLIVYHEDTLVIESDSDAKYYDGAALVNHNWELVSGELRSGHVLHVDVKGYRVNVGESANSFNVQIVDADGNDVTTSYDILRVNGTLRVFRANVTIISNDAEKVYDGKPLTCYEYTVEPSYLGERVKFEVTITGSQTEVGSSQNTIEKSCKIYDGEGNEVTENFNIEYEEGELVVTGQPMQAVDITIRTASDSKFYDGTPLENPNWEIVRGELTVGHTANVDVTGTITNAGQCDNTFTVTIIDSAGNNVSELYNVKQEYGILEVYRVSLTVTAASDEKLYDGEPLVNDGFTLSPANIAEKFTVECKVLGSQTEVGSSPNQVTSCKLFNGAGEDVTRNFDIMKEDGTLTVVERPDELKPELTYVSGSAEKIYDGLPLMSNDCKRTEGELFAGHRAVIEMTASITEAGVVDNTFTVTVYDEYGNDVTHKYKITKETGSLTVHPKPITIITATDGKSYDGTPLENGSYTVTDDEGNEGQAAMATGDKLNVNVSGSIIDPGEITNTVTTVTVTNSEGKDVTKSYKITVLEGSLTVSDPNAAGGYDPSGDLGGGYDPNDNTVYFKVTLSKKDTVYLKFKSYGDFNGTRGWYDAKEYIPVTSNGGCAYYLPAYALPNAGVGTVKAEIIPVAGLYALPYYTGYGGENITESDTLIVKEVPQNKYTVYYYPWGESFTNLDQVMPSEYASYEAEYRSFVYDNYLYVDDSTLNYINSFVKNKGLKANDPEILSKVANAVKGAAVYNAYYNTDMDNAENVIGAFLFEYREGVCRHYAATATLVFRSLGIPARYTEGFVGYANANEETEILGKNAHAWVEVYIDGLGWVRLEVTPSAPKPLELKVTPKYTGKIYDGKLLEAEQSVTGLGALTAKGYTYKVEISGSRTELGITESVIKELVIYAPSGGEVYRKSTGLGENDFIIEYKKGTVQVYISQLSFESESLNKTYDGIELVSGENGIVLSSGKLSNGDRFVISDKASITKIGETSNKFTVRIYRGNRDVTDYYRVIKNYGALEITARDITVTAMSAEKDYDGTPLTCNMIDSGYKASLAEGDYVYSYSVVGSNTASKSVDNRIVDIVIKNQKGEDVTHCYNIKLVNGTLVIKFNFSEQGN